MWALCLGHLHMTLVAPFQIPLHLSLSHPLCLSSLYPYIGLLLGDLTDLADILSIFPHLPSSPPSSASDSRFMASWNRP